VTRPATTQPGPAQSVPTPPVPVPVPLIPGSRIRGRSGMAWARPSRWLPAVVAFALVLLAWKLLADHDHYLLPQPGATFSQLWDFPASYLRSARATLHEALEGLGIGFTAAVILAVAMSQIPLVERALLPLAVVLNVTPVVAVAPALVVVYGFGATPKIIVTAVIVFFPALVNVLIGLRSADPEVLDVLRSLHASTWEVLWRVRLPSALPYVFAAARVCFPLSLIGAVVAEFVTPGSSGGLGTLITLAYNDSQLSRIYAAVICLAVLGVGLSLVVVAAERRVLAWQPERRRT
jgi:NitT/TauT family transport system permease protein